MATRAQAAKRLAELGLSLDPDSGRAGDQWRAVIDAAGRNSFEGDCVGRVVYDFTATAAAFWGEVIAEGELVAPRLTPCPWPAGACEFHDEELI